VVVRPDIAAVLVDTGGLAHIDDLIQQVPIRSLRRAVSRGELVRVLPNVYAAPDCHRLTPTAAAAALSTGGALSHQTALSTWGLTAADMSPLHVTIPVPSQIRPRAGVVIHRARSMPRTVHRNGTPVVHLERSLVDAWVILPARLRRAPVIDAVRRRLTTPARIGKSLSERPNCRGRQQLVSLVGLLERGCHSELEIWGVNHVLDIAGLPPAQQQIPVAQGSRRAYLDAGWENVFLGVEFDGAASHASRMQREADLRRDAWLASLGWLILRFTYLRLTTDVERVRGEIRAAYEVRCRQLAVAPLPL